jgi:putative spermidine/putrescine transport system permease protein
MKSALSLERALALAVRLCGSVFVLLFFAFLVLPVAVVAVMSFTNQMYLTFPPTGWATKWYTEVWNTPRWFLALWNSGAIALPVALLSVILGTLTALAVARSGMRWPRLVAALIVAPLMLPHVIIAIGLYPTMLDLGLASTYIAVIIGHTVVATPFVFTTVSASLQSYDHALELAAMTMGANPWRAFWRVTFPMVRASMATGGVFAFAVSFDELMLSLFLTSPRTITLPRLLWEHLAQEVTPAIAAVATVILAITLVLLGIALIFRRGNADAAVQGL